MLSNVVKEKFPLWAKVLLTIFGGASFVVRLFAFVDDCIAKKASKNIAALIGAILCLTPLSIVFLIVDLISLIAHKEFSGLLA